MNTRWLSSFLLALALCVVSSGQVYASDTNSTASASSVEVTITEEGLTPAVVTVAVGSEVTWINKSGQPLRLSSEPFTQGSLFLPLITGEGGSTQSARVSVTPITDARSQWTTETIEPGQSRTLAFPGSGAHEYYTSHNLDISGTVVVMPETYLDPIIPDTTITLSEETTKHLKSISDDRAVLTFSQATTELSELSPGDVIVSDATSTAPNGFLRKVVKIEKRDGEIVVTTEYASLQDAITQGSLEFRKTFTPADIVSADFIDGVSMVSAADANLNDSFYFKFNDVVLYDFDGNPDTKQDQVKANGTLEMAPGFSFIWLGRDGWQPNFEIVYDIEKKADLEISTGIEANVKKRHKVADFGIGTYTVMAGPVPVVLVGQMTIYVGAEGQVFVGLSTKALISCSMEAGVRYEKGNWYPISDFDIDREFSEPTPKFGVDAKVYAEGDLSIELYGVAGPLAGPQVYLQFVSDSSEDPWFKVYLGLDIIIGVQGEILGRSLGEYRQNVAGYRVQIWQANTKKTLQVTKGGNGTGSVTSDPTGIDCGGDCGEEYADGMTVVLTGTVGPDSTLSWSGDCSGSSSTCTLLMDSDRSVTATFSELNKPLLELTVSKDGDGTGTVTSDPAGISCGSDCSELYTQGTSVTLTAAPDPGSTFAGWSGDCSGSSLACNLVSSTMLVTATFTVSDSPPPTVGMIVIPAGTFQMGCDSSNDSNCSSTEQPLHTVNLSTYYIDKYEVTNERYKACVDAGTCTAPHRTSSISRDSYYGNPTYANYPVIYVDWFQAEAFCAWDGKRLPTEAEWEKAARGSSGTSVYPWGNDAPTCDLANCSVNGYCVGDTTEVGSYSAGASVYDVMDMSGNVWEWVSDWYDSGYYSVSPANNPTGPVTGTYRVHRGGSWAQIFSALRAANRSFHDPSGRLSGGGFRCVRSP